MTHFFSLSRRHEVFEVLIFFFTGFLARERLRRSFWRLSTQVFLFFERFLKKRASCHGDSSLTCACLLARTCRGITPSLPAVQLAVSISTLLCAHVSSGCRMARIRSSPLRGLLRDCRARVRRQSRCVRLIRARRA